VYDARADRRHDLSRQALGTSGRHRRPPSFAERVRGPRQTAPGTTVEEAVAHIEQKDFDGATVMLKDISKEFPFDPQAGAAQRRPGARAAARSAALVGGR
jgi:hypothetical protein